jgi:hypothetical protein
MSALLNDVVMEENVVVENAQGSVEPMPVPPPAFTAASSDATIGNVVMGARADGTPTRKVNAMKLAGSFTATVSAPGLADWVEDFVIGPDVTPTQVAGDAASITTSPQPLPPN